MRKDIDLGRTTEEQIGKTKDAIGGFDVMGTKPPKDIEAE